MPQTYRFLFTQKPLFFLASVHWFKKYWTTTTKQFLRPLLLRCSRSKIYCAASAGRLSMFKSRKADCENRKRKSRSFQFCTEKYLTVLIASDASPARTLATFPASPIRSFTDCIHCDPTCCTWPNKADAEVTKLRPFCSFPVNPWASEKLVKLRRDTISKQHFMLFF